MVKFHYLPALSGSSQKEEFIFFNLLTSSNSSFFSRIIFFDIEICSSSKTLICMFSDFFFISLNCDTWLSSNLSGVDFRKSANEIKIRFWSKSESKRSFRSSSVNKYAFSNFEIFFLVREMVFFKTLTLPTE